MASASAGAGLMAPPGPSPSPPPPPPAPPPLAPALPPPEPPRLAPPPPPSQPLSSSLVARISSTAAADWGSQQGEAKDKKKRKYWKMHSTSYPVLARMARDILAIPASTVASESAFSSGERIVNDYRSRLKSETIEALSCLQDWLRSEDSTRDNIAGNIVGDHRDCI